MNLSGVLNIASLIVGVTLVTVLVRPGNQTQAILHETIGGFNNSLVTAQGGNVRTYAVHR